MNLVALLNSLTVILQQIQYAYFPRRWIGLYFVLYPTVGTVFQATDDVMRIFMCQWHSANGAEDETICDAFIGKEDTVIKDAVIAQYVEYAAGRTYNLQFKELFDYVSNIGIAT